jgi:hypothetical protein
MDARTKRREALICLAATCILTSGLAPVAVAQEASCAESARLLRYACQYETAGDYHQIAARCLDDAAPSEDCLGFAESEYDEAIEECDDVLDARLDLCEALDDAVHEPRFGSAYAADFVDPRAIGGAVAPNPYFPLVAGNRWVYEGGDATITVTVTDEIKRIQDIDCVTVTDVESEDGVVLEDTDDWFAQDVDGNVWYCGETSRNFDVFDNDQPVEPELVDIEGSWKSGRDGAEAGILIPASPEPGVVIRQEVSYGDAEDAIEIVSITASEDVPGGSCADDCLQTRDFTPLEPEAEESKYYAPGIGLILEVEGDERVELVEFQGEGR